MVVAVILDNCLKPNGRGDATPATISFCGLSTTKDRLLESITEDLNFAADWVYVDWIMSNGCSQPIIKTVVTAITLLSTFLYLVAAADGRILLPIFNLFGIKSLGKRTHVLLVLLVALEAIPQIGITLVAENELLESECFDEFASQAVSNLFTSGYAVMSRITNIMEYQQTGKLDQNQEEQEEQEEIQIPAVTGFGNA